jgi:hypothetical protein
MRTRFEGVLKLSRATPEPPTPPASGAANAAERPLSPQSLDVLGSESEVRSMMSGVAIFFALSCFCAPFSAPELAEEVLSLGEDPKKVFSDD